jgi:hypothetical protein
MRADVVTTESQGRGRPTVFTRDVVRQIRHFYAEGMTYEKMGEIVNIHPKTIRAFVSRNREHLQMEKRCNVGFEKDWYGYVPLGHWTICKPWGSKRYYDELREAARSGRDVAITW